MFVFLWLTCVLIVYAANIIIIPYTSCTDSHKGAHKHSLASLQGRLIEYQLWLG